MTVRKIHSFQSDGETLVGDLVLPEGAGPHPALLLIAGTGAQDRYGTIHFPSGKIVQRGLHRWVGERLAAEGIASFCWDKRGVGQSTGGRRKPGEPPGDRDQHADVMTDVEDANQALQSLLGTPEIDPHRVAVLGHSAGVYFACLLAARTNAPAAYVFMGGVHMGIDDFMDFIYGQLEGYIARGPDEKAWAQEHLPYEVDFLKDWRGYREAALRGDDYYAMEIAGRTVNLRLARLKQELAHPLYAQFRNVRKPVLVIHGDQDFNVPPTEAGKIQLSLQESGNDQVSLVVIPGADHSMNVAPGDIDERTRLQQRLEHTSHHHPYSEFFIHGLINWLKDRLQ